MLTSAASTSSSATVIRTAGVGSQLCEIHASGRSGSLHSRIASCSLAPSIVTTLIPDGTTATSEPTRSHRITIGVVGGGLSDASSGRSLAGALITGSGQDDNGGN